MTATRIAVEESIQHWWRLSTDQRGPEERIGVHHCALCRLFYNDPVNGDCARCPVFRNGGGYRCETSPYQQASTLYVEFKGDTALTLWEFRQSAAVELSFLISLRPVTP